MKAAFENKESWLKIKKAMEPKMKDISSKMTLKDEKVQLLGSLRIPSPISYSKPSKVQNTNETF